MKTKNIAFIMCSIITYKKSSSSETMLAAFSVVFSQFQLFGVSKDGWEWGEVLSPSFFCNSLLPEILFKRCVSLICLTGHV